MNKIPKRIDFSKRFDKQFRKSPLEIKIAFKKRIKLFIQDPLSSVKKSFVKRSFARL